MDMDRITKKKLEWQLGQVNKRLAKAGAPLWALDYNRFAGGYQIVFDGAPGNTITHRMPAREMYHWLDGADHTLWSIERIKQ